MITTVPDTDTLDQIDWATPCANPACDRGPRHPVNGWRDSFLPYSTGRDWMRLDWTESHWIATR